MDQAEQINLFVGEIEGVILRFRKEFDLSNAAAIGSLEIVKLNLFRNIMNEPEDDADT